jgi:MinD-like ATPase involved in chromosome partitioning or flagellar assembly
MSSSPVSVFLAGADMPGVVSRLMFPAFNDPARFQIVSMAADWGDVQRDVGRYRPDVLVMEAALAPDPEALREYLAQLVGTIAIVILPPAWADRQGQFESIRTSVRGVFLGPANWAAVASATHTAGVTERTRQATASPSASLYQQSSGPRVGGQVVVGTRVIAFTSFTGGTGKSSIAEALGVELARNHVRTLLCSFNSPPAAAGHFNLRLQPNASEWLNRPNPEGFQAAIQRVRGLDDLEILMAPNDHHALNQIAAGRPPEAADSIRSLVFSAYSFNYGAILLDLPPFADSMWALQPILAANVAVIVCRPTRQDQLGAIRAYKLLTEQLAQQIRIPPEAIYGVMNFASPKDNLSERDFQAAIVDTIGSFPPILSTFPYVPELPGVQNFGNSPIFESACEGFARAARSLAGKLIGAGLANSSKSERSESKGFFGIQFKLK